MSSTGTVSPHWVLCGRRCVPSDRGSGGVTTWAPGSPSPVSTRRGAGERESGLRGVCSGEPHHTQQTLNLRMNPQTFLTLSCFKVREATRSHAR
jgi:hypothetical protein